MKHAAVVALAAVTAACMVWIVCYTSGSQRTLANPGVEWQCGKCGHKFTAKLRGPDVTYRPTGEPDSFVSERPCPKCGAKAMQVPPDPPPLRPVGSRRP